MSFSRLKPSAPHPNLANNLFASACDNRRPIISFGTCHRHRQNCCNDRQQMLLLKSPNKWPHPEGGKRKVASMTVNIPSSVIAIKLDMVELKLDRLIDEMRFLKS